MSEEKKLGDWKFTKDVCESVKFRCATWYKSYVTGSIHGWRRSHSTYREAADSKIASSLRSLPSLLFNVI